MLPLSMTNGPRFFYVCTLRPRLRRFALWVGRLAELPSPYYDGIPADRELDSMVNELDEMKVPRGVMLQNDPAELWPLTPRQRLRLLRRDLGRPSVDTRVSR